MNQWPVCDSSKYEDAASMADYAKIDIKSITLVYTQRI
jgi:hypothetical protein